MSANDEWTQVVPEMSPPAAQEAFKEWRTAHDPHQVLTDDDVRVDLIRTVHGDQARVLIRTSLLPRLGD